MRDETRIDEQEAEEMHEAMDYMQHERTWENITNLIKWAVIQLAFIIVGLFCIIQGGAPAAGFVLIIVGLIAPIGWWLFGPKRIPT